tara:strand:+ start:208 stop:1740 length:1533 start_codon:yes stop_codon:yes gene_type:complete
MADLNALIAQGAQFNLPNPVDQYSKVMQLQSAQQQMQLNREQMQQIQEDRAGFAKLRTTLAQKNLTPEDYELALINSPSKDHQRMGLELRSRRNLLADYDKAQKESGLGAEPPMAPAEVPAPMAAPAAPKPEMFVTKDSSGRSRYLVDGAEVSPQEYQSAQSGVVVGAAPAAKPIEYALPAIDNALAARVAPAEPVTNAMLAQPAVANAMASEQAQIAEINKRLKIATSPRFAEVPNIDKEIARLERQLKQLTENKYHVVDGNLVDETGKAIFTATPKPPSLPTVATMQALGFPLTQAGFNAYFDAQRQDRLLTPKDDPTTTAAFSQVDAAGNVTFYNKFGNPISTQKGAGKPSATFEKTTAQRKQLSSDLTTAINELTEVTKDGGLIDQSTGSGAGRLVDIAARFGGKAMPGDIAIGKLQPVADLVLKMVPRFEGPQSNADTTSYKQAAAQLADPTLPAAIRKEAGKTVMRLMKKRKDQFVTQSMADEGMVPSGGAPAANVDALLDKYK